MGCGGSKDQVTETPKPAQPAAKPEAAATTQAASTVMLTYGGSGGLMGKQGSFDSDKAWFGFRMELLEDKDKTAEAGFEDMHKISDSMKAARVKTFPVPKFKSEVGMEGSELYEISQLDANMTAPNQPDKVPRIGEMMVPRVDGYEEKGATYYVKGPFKSSDQLLSDLQNDPMLKPVHEKWSTFDPSVLEAAFRDCNNLYLQIRWEGWFVRPVRELSQIQFADLICRAKSEMA